MYYKEDKNGQILQEGINEAGALCSWIAAGTSYSTHGVSMIPFYIFYSMFGFQRVGDLDLGGRRQPRARLPARRHRRPHHAERRRAAARGRPQPPAVFDRAQLRLLRPDLRLRARGDHPGRHAPHVQGAGGRLLLHHGDERELRAPGDAGGRGGGHPQGHVPVLRRQRRQEGAARAAAGQRHDPARSDRRRRAAEERFRRGRRTSGAARASPSCAAKAWRSSAGTCCIPSSRSASPTSSSAWKGARARWSPPPTT